MSDMPDLSALLAQAQKMQEQLMEAQATASAQEFEGSAGGGKVRITVSGGGEFRAVHIDASVIDPSDAEMLEDLILAALHDATTRVAEASDAAQQAAMQTGLGGLGDALGLGGGLGGMLGP